MFQMPLSPAAFAKNTLNGTSIRPIIVASPDAVKDSEVSSRLFGPASNCQIPAQAKA